MSQILPFIPSTADSQSQAHDLRELDLHTHLIKRPSSTFFMRYQDRDLLVVDRSLDPQPGSLAVVAAHEDFVLCRVEGNANNLSLQPVDGAEITTNGQAATVWGVVTYHVRDCVYGGA